MLCLTGVVAAGAITSTADADIGCVGVFWNVLCDMLMTVFNASEALGWLRTEGLVHCNFA